MPAALLLFLLLFALWFLLSCEYWLRNRKMLRVKDISKAFDGNLIIKDVSFEVSEGQYFVLLGSSGVGKSLLFETIAGAIYPDTGQIFLDGTDITAEKIQERKIGLVFQDNVLFPHMRVYENVAYPLKCRKMSGPQIEKRVMKLL
jgi:spermidine/putrescine transport system ATP-binding protein